jgi:hypothetical protein
MFILLSEYILRLKQLLIYVELHWRHVDIYDHLDLIREFSGEIGLCPS